MENIAGIAFAVLVLVGLVGYQRLMHHLKYTKLRRLWEEGGEALRAGRLEDAERALQQAVATEGLWIPARQLLAQVYALQGKLDLAEEEFKLAQAFQPKEPMGHFALALFYAQHRPERAEAALESLERAMQLDPATGALLRQHQQHFRGLEGHPRYQSLLGATTTEPPDAG